MANFFERIAVPIPQAVAKLDDLALAIAKGLKDLVNPALQHLLSSADRRAFRITIGEQIAEVTVFTIADRPIEADRIAAHRQHAARFIDRRAGLASCLFDRRLASQSLQQLA